MEENNEKKEMMPIQDMIYTIRGQKVMLDSDLAALYGVELRSLNQAVKRNIERFPDDFMFQLTDEEWEKLRSQIVIAKENSSNLISQFAISSLQSQIATAKKGDSNLKSQIVISSLKSQITISNEGSSDLKSQFATSSWGGKRKLPYVFTEQGVAMLSSVINSKQAIEVNIKIMRAFVQMRHFVLSQSDLDEKYEKLHKLLMLHIDNCDYKFTEQDESIRQIAEVLNNLIEHPKPARIIGFGAE